MRAFCRTRLSRRHPPRRRADPPSSHRDIHPHTHTHEVGGSGYVVVEDVGGKYLAETERLQVLKRRKREIVGGGGAEGH